MGLAPFDASIAHAAGCIDGFQRNPLGVGGGSVLAANVDGHAAFGRTWRAIVASVTTCQVFVLGGSSGIGLEFAKLAAGEPGLDIQVTAPTVEAATLVGETLGPATGVHVVDLLSDSDEKLMNLTAATDVLVLSAGLEYVGPAQFEPSGAFAEMLTVNVAGPAVAVRGCLPQMIERGSGLIVGLGSIVTSEPRPFLAAYAASKAALESYLASLAGEIRGTGVAIEYLALGPVATGLGSNGPPNWEPDPTSHYSDGFGRARAASEREQDDLMRTPTNVAKEILDLVRLFRTA